jgi:ankyrin repeat protein
VFKDNILVKGDFIRLENSTCQMNETLIQYCTGSRFSNGSIDLVDSVFKGTSFYEVDKKVTINVEGKDVDLGLAAHRYTAVEIKQLIEKGAEVNRYISSENNYTYTTPLVQAMRSGKRKNTEILLDNGANLYQNLFTIMDNPDALYGGEIYTILHFANIHFLKILKDYDLNLEVEDEYGATPLFYASFRNYLDKAKFFVERGANINHTSDYWSILGFPAYMGNVEMVKYLVDNGADVNLHKKDGYSPLLYCGLTIGDGFGPYDKDEEKYQIAKYLVEHGADINYRGKRNRYYSLPITISDAIYKSKMCEYLLKQGAKVKYDSLEWTTVHSIAMRGSRFAIEKLINDNYNLYAKSYREVSILSGVVKTRNFKLVKQLIENGIDINENAKGEMRNYSIGPVITEAVERNDLEMVIFLYSLGANINIVDKLDRTPFKVALENNYTEIIQQLKSWRVNE